MNKHTPTISIRVQPAPLEFVANDAWEVDARKLVALYEAAPVLLAALEALMSPALAHRMQGLLEVEMARAAIGAARGEG